MKYYRSYAFFSIIVASYFFLSGCASQNYTYSPPLSPVQAAQAHDRAVACGQIYTQLGLNNRMDIYDQCMRDPSAMTPFVKDLSKALPTLASTNLCELEKTPNFTAAAAAILKKRHTNCAQVAIDNYREAVKTMNNERLCQVWSSRSDAVANRLIDSEVKTRGVRCELVLLQIQQRELATQQMTQQQANIAKQQEYQEQMIEMQQDANRQRAMQDAINSNPLPILQPPPPQPPPPMHNLQQTHCQVINNNMDCTTY
jgi:hypothetical protein